MLLNQFSVMFCVMFCPEKNSRQHALHLLEIHGSVWKRKDLEVLLLVRVRDRKSRKDTNDRQTDFSSGEEKTVLF